MKRKHIRYVLANRQVVGNFYIHGKRKEVKICTFADARIQGLTVEGKGEFKSPRDRKWSENFLQREWEKKRDELIGSTPEKSADGPLIYSLFSDWLKIIKATRSPSTHEEYGVTVGRYKKVIANHPVGAISTREIENFTAALFEDGLEPATIHKHQSALKIFLIWAHRREDLNKIPYFEKINVPRRLPNVWRPEYLLQVKERLDELILTTKNKRHRWYFILHKRFLWMAINTGMRAGEIVYLPSQAIDLDRGVIRVKRHEKFNVKEGRDKWVRINDYLAAYLQGQLTEFPGLDWYLDDGHKNLAYPDPHALWTAFNRHYDALEIPKEGRPKGLHGFRATFADHLHNELDMDVGMVQLWLGHSTPAMTQRYLPDPEKRTAHSMDVINNNPPPLLRAHREADDSEFLN